MHLFWRILWLKPFSEQQNCFVAKLWRWFNCDACTNGLSWSVQWFHFCNLHKNILETPKGKKSDRVMTLRFSPQQKGFCFEYFKQVTFDNFGILLKKWRSQWLKTVKHQTPGRKLKLSRKARSVFWTEQFANPFSCSAMSARITERFFFSLIPGPVIVLNL